MATTWVEDLESSISKLKKQSVPQQSNTVFLFGIILLLSFGVLGLMKYKSTGNIWQPTQSQWLQNQQTAQTPQWQQSGPVGPGPTTTDQRVDALKAQYDKLDAIAHKIWDRTKWNSDRMTLLATINNHNLVVTQQNYPKSELIYLNDDWTIDRLPNRIQLDPVDQAFIQQFVRK